MQKELQEGFRIRKLAYEVNLLSCALKDAGIKKGDTVGIYMPLIPEAIFAIFACSKIGAVHTTIFQGLLFFPRESWTRTVLTVALIASYIGKWKITDWFFLVMIFLFVTADSTYYL